jgi:hypothetical protein
MQVQDGVLLASAVIWVLDRPNAFAWMRTDAPSLTNIVASNVASITCSSSLQRSHVIVRSQTGRRS